MRKAETRQEKEKSAEPKSDKPEPTTIAPSNAPAEWCDEEIKLLVKGVKVIALGTRDRFIHYLFLILFFLP